MIHAKFGDRYRLLQSGIGKFVIFDRDTVLSVTPIWPGGSLCPDSTRFIAPIRPPSSYRKSQRELRMTRRLPVESTGHQRDAARKRSSLPVAATNWGRQNLAATALIHAEWTQPKLAPDWGRWAKLANIADLPITTGPRFTDDGMAHDDVAAPHDWLVGVIR